MFNILSKSKESNARLGIITTSHGVAETPCYVVVGTHAEVRTLTPADIRDSKTQMIIANTYHLWRTLGDEGLKTFEGLHQRMKWDGVIMTDSGGFQVFSLGFAREHGVGKVAPMFPGEAVHEHMVEANLVRITDDGAFFKEDGVEKFLDAEKSIVIQEFLGADIILAFDECTSPLHDHAYTERAMERTHRWAVQSLEAKMSTDQFLYGIVQGGAFEDLRKKSAEYIGSLPFDGFAIGGSLGKSREEMFDVIRWSVPFLAEEKPRHLLGIGKIEDLFDGVALGMDTFDCVIPTREARHGGIWTRNGRFDIRKGINMKDLGPIEEGCECPTCTIWKIRRKDLFELFKIKAPEAARFATMHNVYFFNALMQDIRIAIKENRFLKLKEEVLSRV